MTYHYKESGLDNIWIANGYKIQKTSYGEGLAIQDVEGLHNAIGNWLISLPKPLTGAEVRFIRLEMEMTQRGLGAIIGADEQSVRRWERARPKAISGPADRLIRVLYREYMHGDGLVRDLVDRLADLDQIAEPTAEFFDTKDGWVNKDSLVAA